MKFTVLARSFVPLLLAFGILTGCAGGLPPAAELTASPPQYQIAANDQLRVTVFDEESLSGEHVVTSEGNIAFPLLGDIQVAGRTPSDVRELIYERLSPDYMSDPRINVEVLSYRPVYVLGEVGRSGTYDYVPEMTATQAIAAAGGYTYRADKSRVIIRRRDDPQERTYELRSDRPVWVMPGDTITVGERYF